MIRLKNISKDYVEKGRTTQALRGVDLRIDVGEMAAVMGASGSGKSTLLHILGGMDRATAGEYFFEGNDISGYVPAALHRFRKENVSFVFQSFALLNSYTVYENVEMPLRARKIRKRSDKIMECLEKMGIAQLRDKLPTQLSGGERQRCAIARALAADTPLLLADEPTGSLDRATGQVIMNRLCELNRLGKTVLVVTHDPQVAERCGRIIWLEDGKIVTQEKTEGGPWERK